MHSLNSTQVSLKREKRCLECNKELYALIQNIRSLISKPIVISQFQLHLFIFSPPKKNTLFPMCLSPPVCRWHPQVLPGFIVSSGDTWPLAHPYSFPAAPTDYIFINRCSESPQIFPNLGHSWNSNPPELSVFSPSGFHVVQKSSLFLITARTTVTTFIHPSYAHKKERAVAPHFMRT